MFESPRASARPAVWDAVGLGLLLGLVAWTYLAPRPDGGDPQSFAVALAVPALAYGLGRVTALVGGTVDAGVGIGLVVLVVLLAGDWRGPLAGLLGYANATAALAVAGGAAAALGVTSASVATRRLSTVLVLALCAAPFVLGSLAAAGGALVVLIAVAVVLTTSGRRRARPAMLLAGYGTALLALTAGAAAAVGARWGGADEVPAVVQTLSLRRAALWHDALEIIVARPVTGTGARTYASLAPTAVDPDTQAAHSLLLEVTAELGLVGVTLLACLLVWALARTALGSGSAVPVAVATWTAFVLQSGVDYVADFWPVTACVAAVLGLATDVPTSARVRTARRPPG